MIALGAIAFGGGALVGGHAAGAPARRVATEYTNAWARGDYSTMWQLTDQNTRRTRSAAAFAAAYRAAATIATQAGVRFGHPHRVRGGAVDVPAVISTRVFGRLHETVRLPIADEGGSPHVIWTPALVFPGLRVGERLRRTTALPPRASLLFRDRTALARGAQRTSAYPDIASSIAGALGPIPAGEAQRLAEEGVPKDALVGTSGLERVFDDRLRGTPGGTLYAGRRLLASRPPRRAPAVRTTISRRIQATAIEALAGRLGGAIALNPRTGEVLAAAGIAWSALQPPGSTFKIVTLTAALEGHVAKPSSVFPVQTAATLSGVELRNANGESCGGTLAEAFAVSCNSVFAPLGVRVGARHLVSVAHSYGFGEDPGIPGAATSSIPPASELGDDLGVGSSAIGQGRVQATALQMALIASTVADNGLRPRPTLLYGQRRTPVRATSAAIARTVGHLMYEVVDHGTGVHAQIPGVRVAGKTGTAELRSTVPPAADQAGTSTTTVPPTPEDTTQDTDAWFTAFAPQGHGHLPRAAVCVLLVKDGAGGDTAAPAARLVLSAALQ